VQKVQSKVELGKETSFISYRTETGAKEQHGLFHLISGLPFLVKRKLSQAGFTTGPLSAACSAARGWTGWRSGLPAGEAAWPWQEGRGAAVGRSLVSCYLCSRSVV